MNQPIKIEQSNAADVVRSFLRALEEKDHYNIARLLAPDLRYTNVSLPTVTGGQQVADLFKRVLVKGVDMTLHIHDLAVTGNTVMTERTDVIKIGPFHARFWVFGTFHVENGQIVLWRDYFDWLNITKGIFGGIAGLAFRQWRERPLSVP